DGIRDRNVTGVQTCALPISLFGAEDILGRLGLAPGEVVADDGTSTPAVARVVETFARYAAGEVIVLESLEVRQAGGPFTQRAWRSEERRVGQGGRRAGGRAE